MTRINVAILGASGYGAGELLRLFTQHPHVRVVGGTSQSQPGEPIAALHPHLNRFYDLRTAADVELSALADADFAVVISALPHGASAAAIGRLWDAARAAPFAAKVRLIDLSGDLRLRDLDSHRRHYPETPAFAEIRELAEYGLPELAAERIAEARIVANPGCLATAGILAAAPLVRDGFTGSVVIDAKTGSSGSGRQLKESTHHPTRHADFRAYKPLAHQHEGEILQAWGDARGGRISLSFVAQSMDVSRGIFATAHMTLPQEIAARELKERYVAFYSTCPFVRIVEGSPTLQDVVGSNFCDISVAARGRQVIAMVAIDNLVKGMAGTAIQNLNLMCGLPQETGLWTPSLRPI
ncbi:MAG: N-acetyl-gamma-glutamyl-phosphate reductase [Phycisphaerae bacterium]